MAGEKAKIEEFETLNGKGSGKEEASFRERRREASKSGNLSGGY
ncbi:MAG: hypothetical protein ACJAQT_004644 [Akkermansiaceae bacterium]|jgi:hypothetical protein